MTEQHHERPLAGQVAIVTGGGQGIGRAIALRLARDGLDIVIADQWLLAHHAIGRFGQPAEVAAAILFLASDEASFITGANLAVDSETPWRLKLDSAAASRLRWRPRLRPIEI